ncbi:hypothetical protein Cst_c27380 [Thermoclostridium stercorarium subsp. stercorarium DSM 8532]|uniref:UPF0316 protein Cst_c27380 n=3 Tax=Thermoclostridium stercorarium TaxID=1510 RepID=L7VTL3_THES1|nr:DUF2179 domain-containing protein [Thermoclostridium stercorarium]AGC69681.1 hypothetical protein Cst_c27380 [Thermoclostridium stercorarium subsp. stercorarium DSM 8532]AGI40634.1 hypothetical protein Clst_2625 [Thermoclostridium stercorarium subsp. stercorarium DSM 8532]ANW99901.1 hypothetical protein CSTERTH_13125 [Thermoclostridium stercorarium subsp. thermolacticum DSM 2910]ANX02526.1 hypothetical protein CSTERLE_13630 [Thermoclostridium stercorarium subsp. leptospartum DSM 9219]UZQ856
MQEFLSGDFFKWVVFPVLIILARMVDVTLGTLRIIFVSRGNRVIAPILGFFEVLVWVIAISQIMQNLDNPINYVAYALGFAIGNYLGIKAEDKLAIGHLVIRLFITEGADGIMRKIIDAGFGVTSIKGMGATNEVTILFSVIKRKDLDTFLSIINESDKKIFYSVETAREAHLGIYPQTSAGIGDQNGYFIRKITGGFNKRK